MSATSSNPIDRIQSSVRKIISQGVPGLSLTISTPDKSYSYVDGLANIDAKEPITSSHIFGIGSITKVFLSVVVHQLIDEGKLSLDAQVSDLLKEDVWHGIPNAGKTTIGSLMRHQSGIPSWEDDPEWIRVGRGSKMEIGKLWRKDETLDFIRYDSDPTLNPPSPLPKPGEYSYSNTNHTLLGLIVESITSTPITSVIHQRINNPLSLSHTYLEGYEGPQKGTLPNRYHNLTPTYLKTAGQHPDLSPSKDRPDLLDVTPTNLSVSWMAGGFISHTSDLCKFGLAVRNTEILSEQSRDRMYQFVSTGTEGSEIGYGVFKLDKGKNGSWYGHTGGVLGFSAALFWSEREHVAVAMLGNAGVVHAGKIVNVTSLMSEKGFLEAVSEWAKSKSE